MAPINVLCAATSYPADNEDWRGVFIRHLVDALARREDIQLSLWAPPGPLPDNVRYLPNHDEERMLSGLMAAGGIAHLMRSRSLSGFTAPLKLLRSLHSTFRRESKTDLYHLNWLQTALPLPADGKPVLVTVLGTDLKLLALPFVKFLIRRSLASRPAAICPNADWMVSELRDAFGDKALIEPVMFGIDPVWYAVQRRPTAQKPKWLAVTRLTREKLGPLFKWSAPLFNGQDRELHLLGPMQEQVTIPDWVHYHGPASPEALANEWFPQAHGLITLSRHDEGRPQVMLEAMASGLPIIASDMPAHASLVQSGVTGSLCESQQTFAAALSALEDLPSNRHHGEAARAWVKADVGTWDDCAQRYAAIYNRLAGHKIG
ncbi:glycosyltransferase family 4 protein [Haliea sp.]|uniref:glycosyltransferase family 4 protein n=1 Tax=Haliea sp. TaxID=1932666 RepID=UPI003529531F